MGFADITQMYLSPSALTGDPDVARRLFLRDLSNFQRVQQSSRARPAAQQHQAYEQDLRARHSGQQGYGYLAPGAETDRRWNPREKPAGHPQQYLLDRIAQEQAILRFDQEAPRLREEQRALRG